MLRTANKPLRTDKVSLLCQELKQLPTDSESDNKTIQKIVVETLRGLEKINLVEQVGKEGLYAVDIPNSYFSFSYFTFLSTKSSK